MKKLQRNITEQLVEAAVASIGNSARRMLGKGVSWATYNYQGGVLGGTASGPTYSEGLVGVAEVKLDFAAIAAARIAAGQAALAAADILKFVGVPAGTYVPWVGAQVSVVEGGAATVDIGDAGTDDGFIDTIDLNALGRAASLAVTAYSVAVGGGKFYNADDFLTATLNSNNVDVSVLSLFVGMVDMRKTR